MNASSYQNASATTACVLCRDAGATLLTSVRPAYTTLDGIPAGLSCGDLHAVGAERWSRNETACDAWRIAFSDECCDGGGGIPSSSQSIPPYGGGILSSSQSIPPYECEESVRSALLGDESGYGTMSAPLPSADVPHLNVSTSIMYLHATEISTVEGTAELFFNFVLVWPDERLSWDPAPYGGCTRFFARASSDAEKTELWVPDFDLLNRVSGLQTLPDASAIVQSDGTVTWRRLGGVKGICLFEGLERFPYDELGCEFVFGPAEAYPVNYVLNEDALFAAAGKARVDKYREYSLLRDRTVISYDERGGTKKIGITFVFERASQYYTNTLVVPTIIFTFISFGMFLLDIRVGERLSFGVSLLLVIVANSILTADMLPVCASRLWINVLTMSSYYWVMAALIESIAVAYLYFLEKEERDAAEREQGQEERNRGEGKERAGGEERGRKQASEQSDDRTLSARVHSDDAEEGGNGGGSRAELVRGVLTRKLPFRVTLKHILISSPNPSLTWRMRTIRRMDRICVVVFPVTYIAFFSTMLARNKYW